MDITVERAPVGIAHFDASGRFIFVNPQLCAILGFTRERLLDMTFQEVSFPDDLPRCLEMTRQLALGQIQRYALEKRFVRPEGDTVFTRVIVTAVRSAGQLAFFLGIVEDITEQWVAEQARREATERLNVALEASETGIYRYDFRTQSLDWSNGLAEVFGFDKDDEWTSLDRLLGAIHPDDLPQVLAAYERSATRGADFDEEFRIVRPDGVVRWISDRARMTLDESGKPRYLTGACIDVTARREAEAARTGLLERERAARADAERALHLRDEVLAVVAHDLRNPVHTIMMSSGAAVELPLSSEDQSQQFRLIRRAARGMDALIRDLLDSTKIEMGRMTVELAPESVADIVAESVAAANHAAAERGVRIEVDIAGELPPVLADRGRIMQVLGNLLGNSLKFTPARGNITIRARALPAVVEIAVEDTGSGIEPAHLTHVFEKYWQAHRGAGRGVGLGLAIVRGIVEAHGGTIGVKSAVGEGTTFRFTLVRAPGG